MKNHPRGGFILQVLFLLAVIASAFVGWRWWNSRLRAEAGANQAKVVPVQTDALWAQNAIRDLLASSGFSEVHIERSYNKEVNHRGVRWVEETLELKPPSGFNIRAFAKKAEQYLKKKKIGLLTQKDSVLEFGSEDMIFERLIFHTP